MSHNYDRSKTAAMPVEFQEMPTDKQEILKYVPSNWKVLDVFDGIRGWIIVFKGNGGRLTTPVMKKMMAFKDFRWVETDAYKGYVSVAF